MWNAYQNVHTYIEDNIGNVSEFIFEHGRQVAYTIAENRDLIVF